MNLPSNVILVGFMGSGKTSTGKELARLLDYRFWDMDQLIEEKMKMSVSQIFVKKGESFFREQEKEMVEWLKSQKKCVVSTGGGVWIDKENREKLMEIGFCVWLMVSAPKALERMGSHLAQRPLLSQSPDPLAATEKMLADRIPFYSMAHAQFETDKKNPKEVALEILRVLNEGHSLDLSKLQK